MEQGKSAKSGQTSDSRENSLGGDNLKAEEKAAPPQTHTPGPWEMSGTTVYGSLGSNPDICEAFNEDEHTVRGISKAEAEANARLIAAAPELLEALELANDDIIWMSGSADFSPGNIAHEGWLKVRPRLERYKAAIAKARGRQL